MLKALKLKQKFCQTNNKFEKIRGFCCLFLSILVIISSQKGHILHKNLCFIKQYKSDHINSIQSVTYPKIRAKTED